MKDDHVQMFRKPELHRNHKLEQLRNRMMELEQLRSRNQLNCDAEAVRQLSHERVHQSCNHSQKLVLHRNRKEQVRVLELRKVLEPVLHNRSRQQSEPLHIRNRRHQEKTCAP
ncbi:hypothetical protein [Mariniblastus fucicola]|uniref:hypothetical protein n=1 Tax=Mariniblastus fucicola TaxID=980251 RepID=UPI0011DF9A17|nr:hypothetical protein [Mariniblastus fucicola]